MNRASMTLDKPDGENTSLDMRLMSAAMAIKRFCEKHPRCGKACPFYRPNDKGAINVCSLTPYPSLWNLKSGETNDMATSENI